jgi:hypothetical protein
MKLEFLPGELLLQYKDGAHTVTIAGRTVLETRSQRLAIQKYNEIRKRMEEQFPARPLTSEEKEELLQQAIGDSLVGHNSLGGRKKKTTAGGTRTFGG